MKTKFFSLMMVFLLLVIQINSRLQSQTLHEVDFSGLSFAPQSLSISVGDIVRWTNTGGTHNFNGTIATFPTNPLSLRNDLAPAGWVYTYVFTGQGTYNYQCDFHVNSGMTGSITVNGATSSVSPYLNEVINIYLNPAG